MLVDFNRRPHGRPLTRLLLLVGLVVAGFYVIFRKSMSEKNGQKLHEVSHQTIAGVEVLFGHADLICWKFGDGDCVTRQADGRLEPRYSDYIRSHITAPSPRIARKLTSPLNTKHFSQAGESQYLEDRNLTKQTQGFFVEAGAYDGETYSNSLFYEIWKNWTGLLVEANPDLVHKILAKNRQAYVFGGCLSPSQKPHMLQFRSAYGGLVDTMAKTQANVIREKAPTATVNWVQCFPLEDLLDAIGVTSVDYLSLDVEGAELDILRTVDFSRTHIELVTVEYRVQRDIDAGNKKLKALRQLFASTGLYREVGIIHYLDVAFKRI